MARGKKDFKVNSNLAVADARLIFKNFSGKESKFNPPGKRNFCVALPEADGSALAADGWNIKYLQPREEGDPEQAYLKVNVEYTRGRPPEIILITDAGQRRLDEDTVNMLDWADIRYVDLIISPYNWEVNGKEGVAAYLKKMYITIEEDEFAAKYRIKPGDVEDDAPPWD